MKASTLAAGGAVLALLGVLGYLAMRPDPDRVERAPAPAEGAAPEAAPTAATAEGAAVTERAAPAAHEPGPAAPEAKPGAAPAASAPKAPVRGIVIDVRSHPVPDVRVVFRSTPDGAVDLGPQATTNDRGEFEIPRADGNASLLVSSPRWLTVIVGHPPRDKSRRAVVVVAETVEVGGAVTDESGAPIEGAELEARLPADFRSRFREILDDSVDEAWSAKSDADGRFQFAGVPVVEGAMLHAKRAGFEPQVEPLPSSTTATHSIVLRKAGRAGGIDGTVLDAEGRPAAGASVSRGIDCVRTDDAGHFHLVAAAGTRAVVSAARKGSLPASATVDVPATGAAATVVLRLGGAPLTITGRVVNAKGEPVVDATVWTGDPTYFAEAEDVGLQSTESVLGGQEWVPTVETNLVGRFELRHLVARDYAICALDPKSLRLARRERVTAGSRDVEIVLPDGGLVEKVAGCVVDRRGAPVAGAHVSTSRNTFLISNPAGTHVTSNGASGPSTKTDAEGRFELARVAVDDVELHVSAESIVSRSIELEGRTDLERLEVVVSRRCYFQIELARPSEADAFEMQDREGNVLHVSVRSGNTTSATTHSKLAEGASLMSIVEETAKTLVLYLGHAEVRRVPVELKPDAPTVLRP